MSDPASFVQARVVSEQLDFFEKMPEIKWVTVEGGGRWMSAGRHTGPRWIYEAGVAWVALVYHGRRRWDWNVWLRGWYSDRWCGIRWVWCKENRWE
jgi:hypothetical protein